MPKSNYGRFKDGVQISGVNLNVHQKGKVYYVCNSSVTAPLGLGGNNGNDGLTPERPFSTLDYAIGKCTANRGDKIIVMPGHAETVSGATTIAMDVAGISIIGLGDGALKPLFSFSATDSNIAVSAANIKVQGIAILATIDSVVAAFTISAAGVEMDIETRDTSAAIEFISCFVTTAGGDNLKLKARHRGFVAGNAMVRYIDLVGVVDAEIDVDFFGIASTAVVNMRTTACDNIMVKGNFYNDSAALTKNVVNSTTATWSVDGYDAKAARHFAGSDDLAVHYTDGGDEIESALGTDGTTVTDSATTVLGAIGADNANNAFASTSVVANADGSVLERMEYLQVDQLAQPRCVEKSDGAVLSGTDALFDITGGPVNILSIIGIVTTQIGAGTTNVKLVITTTSPAATVDMNAAAVDIDADAAGTSYSSINTTAIFTPVTAGFVMRGNAFATNETQFLAPIGTIGLNSDAARAGVIKWYLQYVPLSPNSRVVAAA